MNSAASVDITQLLAASREGDREAWERVVAEVYADLRGLARRHREPGADATIDTTGLVHECYLRLAQGATPNDRHHFFALASRIMRQVVIDHARERLAAKRGAGAGTIPLDHVSDAELAQAREFVALDDALEQLARERPQYARIVECRFFGGLTEAETAEALGLSLRVVQRDWAAARHILAEALAS
jgi:RNA polymerase sigma factor (TIGR02999 family)